MSKDNCDHSINRLNDKESIEFDKLYLKFVKTGRWAMAMSQFKKWMRREFADSVFTSEDRKVSERTWLGALRWVLEKAQEAQTNEKTMQDILEEIIEEVGD